MSIRKIKPRKVGNEMTLDEPRLVFPTFHIELKHLPEARKWNIGTTYHIALEIKQTSIEVSKGRNGEERGHAGFDITGIEVLKNSDHNSSHKKELPDLA